MMEIISGLSPWLGLALFVVLFTYAAYSANEAGKTSARRVNSEMKIKRDIANN